MAYDSLMTAKLDSEPAISIGALRAQYAHTQVYTLRLSCISRRLLWRYDFAMRLIKTKSVSNWCTYDNFDTKAMNTSAHTCESIFIYIENSGKYLMIIKTSFSSAIELSGIVYIVLLSSWMEWSAHALIESRRGNSKN